MSDPCILIVEQDLLVRTPLAEYLRECGYLVLEASSAGDARAFLEDGSRRIDIVLAEVKSGEPSGFALASWVRTHLPHNSGCSRWNNRDSHRKGRRHLPRGTRALQAL